MRLLSWRPRAVTVERVESPLDGLALHLADLCGEDWRDLGPQGQQWYRTMAELAVSAAKERVK